MTHLCSLQCEEQSICRIYKYKWFWSTERYGNKQLKLSTLRENNLLLSITGSTGCGSPFLKNARAYNSPMYIYFIIKLKTKQKIVQPIWSRFDVVLPELLSSSFMMHSSPLLVTFNIPSHAHLLTSHSSALKWISPI